MAALFGGDHSPVHVGEISGKEGGILKIKVDELTKKYNNKVILDKISLDLPEISALGIIGSSGCGKSTLLRHLAGIEFPDSGEITVDQRSPILEKKLFQQGIGMVFQQHNLFPHLSIFQNITLILHKIMKKPKEEAEAKALQLLEEFYLLEQKDKRPSEISGGQAQRASIARALATDPGLIFLDEPTAALDPQLTFEVLQSVERLKNRGIHFIFVTHEMKFLQNFADYFIFMEKGRVLEQGPVTQLDHPETETLQDFLKPHFR